MPTKLHQIIAVRSGKTTRLGRLITETNKRLQKPALFNGLTRNYHPTQEAEGEQPETLPPEHNPVQFRADELLKDVQKAWTELLDLTATQDTANTQAKATVQINGTPILDNVPVTFLIFLEKQLEDIYTVISNVPVRDPGETWSKDDTTDLFASEEFFTNRMKKVPKTHVKYPATEHQEAQTEMYYEDVKVGEWHAKKFSGAMSQKEKNTLLDRTRQLQDAVKVARAEANEIEIEQQKVGTQVFGFIFGQETPT